MRSASSSASSRYCVVSRTVVPSRDQRPHRLPDLAASPRVQPGGRLVEEEHARSEDQPRGEIQPPAHPARVRRHRAVPRVREPEALEQLVRAAAGVTGAQVVEPPEHDEVLPAAEDLVDRGALTDQPDAAGAPAPAWRPTSKPAIVGPPVVEPGQRAEDAHRRRLTGSVRAQQAAHRAFRDAQVEAAQADLIAEALGHVAPPITISLSTIRRIVSTKQWTVLQ